MTACVTVCVSEFTMSIYGGLYVYAYVHLNCKVKSPPHSRSRTLLHRHMNFLWLVYMSFICNFYYNPVAAICHLPFAILFFFLLPHLSFRLMCIMKSTFSAYKSSSEVPFMRVYVGRCRAAKVPWRMCRTAIE